MARQGQLWPKAFLRLYKGTFGHGRKDRRERKEKDERKREKEKKKILAQPRKMEKISAKNLSPFFLVV
jgi:hypothetical protein